jgi:predicted dehydrogenase
MGDTARWAVHGGEWEEIAPDAGTDRGWRVEADFVDSVLHGAPVRLTNFDDGLKYMRFIDGAWQSWQTGQAVNVSP